MAAPGHAGPRASASVTAAASASSPAVANATRPAPSAALLHVSSSAASGAASPPSPNGSPVHLATSIIARSGRGRCASASTLRRTSASAGSSVATGASIASRIASTSGAALEADASSARRRHPPQPPTVVTLPCDAMRASMSAARATPGTAPRSGEIPSVVTARASAPCTSPARTTADIGGRPSPVDRATGPTAPGETAPAPPPHAAASASAARTAARTTGRPPGRPDSGVRRESCKTK